ncbi:hypothetical protein Clow_00108 [Corynebacterium lowii]|uniref:Uncharacterized protein n=2 Tax=Corynebacterium lowii TaxID=1544413 RepID=A0A0Q0U541_9CORY|nr:hypothetical protein Clow_00108 [Corynebacterium lowii]
MTPEMHKALADVEAAAAALNDAKVRRDDAVRKATKVGVPIAHIAAAANLSRQHVYNLNSD